MVTPLPVEPIWGLPAVCEMLRISRRRLYDLIALAGIRDANYRRDGQHPRRVRVFTSSEVKSIAKAHEQVRKGAFR